MMILIWNSWSHDSLNASSISFVLCYIHNKTKGKSNISISHTHTHIYVHTGVFISRHVLMSLNVSVCLCVKNVIVYITHFDISLYSIYINAYTYLIFKLWTHLHMRTLLCQQNTLIIFFTEESYSSPKSDCLGNDSKLHLTMRLQFWRSGSASVEDLFIAITPRSTLTQNGNLSYVARALLRNYSHVKKKNLVRNNYTTNGNMNIKWTWFPNFYA